MQNNEIENGNLKEQWPGVAAWNSRKGHFCLQIRFASFAQDWIEMFSLKVEFNSDTEYALTILTPRKRYYSFYPYSSSSVTFFTPPTNSSYFSYSSSSVTFFTPTRRQSFIPKIRKFQKSLKIDGVIYEQPLITVK